jgi:hypothetical protein
MYSVPTSLRLLFTHVGVEKKDAVLVSKLIPTSQLCFAVAGQNTHKGALISGGGFTGCTS